MYIVIYMYIYACIYIYRVSETPLYPKYRGTS